MFNPNDFFLFALVSVVILFILAQSVYFLIKAWRRAKELGFTAAVLKKTAVSSATFTIAACRCLGCGSASSARSPMSCRLLPRRPARSAFPLPQRLRTRPCIPPLPG